MKYCYNQATTLKNSDLEQDIMLAEAAGFDYIELWLCQIDTYMNDHTDEDLASLFNGRRIKPFALDSFEDILFSEDPDKLKQDFLKACKYGAILGVNKVVMVPTVRKGINEQYTKAEIDKEAVSVLRHLAGLGKPYDMQLAFEPIGFADCAVRSMEHALDIVKQVDMDNVGLTLDVFNEYLYCGLKDIEFIRQIPGEKIFIFHIDDAPVKPLDQYKADHSDRVRPGEGGLPCREFIKLVRETGFDEEASVELFNEELYGMDPKDAIQLCYKSVKAVLKD